MPYNFGNIFSSIYKRLIYVILQTRNIPQKSFTHVQKIHTWMFIAESFLSAPRLHKRMAKYFCIFN